jgi:tRNA dimethylallyltransferase
MNTAHPLIVLTGPTASGKTALSLKLAQHFHGEIVSCDSVAVYRGMEIGTAKPSLAERALVPHHLIDVASPDQPCTAGDYSRLARQAIAGIASRGKLPIVAGGTGLYLRALVDGLFPAPPRQDDLRERLRAIAAKRGPAYLHRILARLDKEASNSIHSNDIPKVVRAIEVSLAAKKPMTAQWQQGREALTGYRILRLGLNPPRERLYRRIDARAAAMFDRGLIEETARLLAQFGPVCRPLASLGYAEAVSVLRGESTLPQAIAHAQQGHRNYSKRQGTWFRREPGIHWLAGCGEDEAVWDEARRLVEQHLVTRGTSCAT